MPTPTIAELRALGLDAGLCAVGAAAADPFDDVRVELERRRDLGLHGGMQFTFRNPARSTDPDRALPGASSLIVGAYDYQRTPPPMPTGVGGHRWWGKSSNILVPGVGSLVVLGAVITDAHVEPDHDEPMADGCRTCTACLDGCPTGAIIEPGVIDARRCLAWLVQTDGMFPVEYREALGDRIYGCDDCQDVCPPNKVRMRRPSEAGADEAWVDVLSVLTAGDDELMERLGRWYVPNRDPAYLRRNALIVLGNVADPTPAVIAVVERYLYDPNPLLRAHAVWTARRLGVGVPDDLASDPADEVRNEVARA